MKKFTNHAPGTRGVLMKDGTTIFIDPGKSVEIDETKISKLPDLGAKPARSQAETDDATAEIEKLKADHATALKAEKDRADDAEKKLKDATAEIEKLKKSAT